jgi:multiple sugar transport system substrate-binding protein
MLFASGALVFSGMGRSDRAVAQDATRLVQWYHQYGEAGADEAVQRYATQYTEENPDVEIEVVWQLGDYSAALNAALLTDEAPDIFELGAPPTVDHLRQNQITSLEDIYTDEIRADFRPETLEACSIDGTIYAVKMIEDNGGLFYRKSMLEEAGVEPPQSLDEVIAAAQTLNQGRVKGLFVGNDAGVGALGGPILWSAGGDFLNEDATAPAFNTERVAAAWTKYAEFAQGDALLMGAPTDWFDPSAFNQGLAAMAWGGIWAVPAMNEALGDDYGVIPWPKSDDEGEPSSFWGGWYECVNGNGQNIDAAKAFVKWLWIDNIEAQQDWCLSYGFHVPARISAGETAEQLESGVAADMVTILDENARLGSVRWTAAMGTAYTDAITNIVRNGADAAEELAKAEETVIAELAR